MRLGILTRSLPPELCGIGDHTLRLAGALKASGHDVVLIAGRGAPADGVHIVGDEWNARALKNLQKRLDTLSLDHLILQYTPLMYTRGDWRSDQALSHFWLATCARMPTSLIAHETYYRTWRHLPSLIRGSWQKHVLKSLATAAGYVFSASEPLVGEMNRWGLKRAAVRLPIGSNTEVAPCVRATLRGHYGLVEDEIVLTLFGCANNLRMMPRHFEALERRLDGSGIAHRWLLLGGVPREFLSARSRALSPGRLSDEVLSAHLQMTDIFLMPHYYGVSAKRGTLMTALAHGLPVVGTCGAMTDSFLSNLPGIAMFKVNAAGDFSDGVLALCRDKDLRQSLGARNRDYFCSNLMWPDIANKLSSAISLQRQKCKQSPC